MIINTLKHLRSTGSERTPERHGDESWEEEERSWGVMMCLRMICRIATANHFVPVVTPLGRILVQTLLANPDHTFTEEH